MDEERFEVLNEDGVEFTDMNEYISDNESEDDYATDEEAVDEEMTLDTIKFSIDTKLTNDEVSIKVGDCLFTWSNGIYTQVYDGELIFKEKYVGDLKEAEELVNENKKFLIGLNEGKYLTQPLKSNLNFVSHYNREYESIIPFSVRDIKLLYYKYSEEPVENVITYFGKDSGFFSAFGPEHNDVICLLSGVPDDVNDSELSEFFTELDGLSQLIADRQINYLKEKPMLRYNDSSKSKRVKELVFNMIKERYDIACDKFNFEMCEHLKIDAKGVSGDFMINDTRNPCFKSGECLYVNIGNSLVRIVNNDYRVFLMSNFVDESDLKGHGALSAVVEIIKDNDDLKPSVQVMRPLINSNGSAVVNDCIADKLTILIIGQGEYNKYSGIGFTNNLITSSNKNYVEFEELGLFFSLKLLDKIFFTEKAWNVLKLNNSSWVKEATIIIDKKEVNKVRILNIDLNDRTFTINNYFIDSYLVNNNFVYDMNRIEKDVVYNAILKSDKSNCVGVKFNDNRFGKIEFSTLNYNGENLIVKDNFSLILASTHIKFNVKSEVRSSVLKTLRSFDDKGLLSMEKEEEWLEDFKQKMVIHGDDKYIDFKRRDWVELDLSSKLTINKDGNDLKVCKVSEFNAMTTVCQNKVLPIEDEFLVSKRLTYNSLVETYKSITRRFISYSEICFSLFYLKEYELNAFKSLMVPMEARNYKVEILVNLTREQKCHNLTDFKLVDKTFNNDLVNWFCFKRNKLFISHGWYLRLNGITFITDYSLNDLIVITQLLGRVKPSYDVYLDDDFYDYDLTDQVCWLMDNKALHPIEPNDD